MPVATGPSALRFRWVETADWPTPSGGVLRSWRSGKEIVVPPHFPLDFPGTASIAVHVDGPSWVATRLAPSAGLVVVQASRWAMRIQRTKTMASKQTRKQATSAAKADTGDANKPARNRQRASR